MTAMKATAIPAQMKIRFVILLHGLTIGEPDVYGPERKEPQT